MSPVYLFIQIQILIGFQPNRFVTKSGFEISGRPLAICE
jgi:hypothetical protein